MPSKNQTKPVMSRGLPALAAAVALLGALVALSGCAVGPKYKTPEVKATATENWVEKSDPKIATQSLADSTWWKSFNDPALDKLVDEAQGVMDPKKRLDLYHRINRLWIDDVAAVPLYQQLDLYGVNKRLDWKARSDELLKAYDMAIKESK